MKKIIMFVAFLSVLFVYSCGGDSNSSSNAKLANPAVVYCTDLGYKYDANNDRCVFKDNTYCNVWDFYRGLCGESKTYCEQNGGQIKSVTDNTQTTTYQYAVCVFGDGTECLEQDYMNGKCSPGQCDYWKLSEGGCVK